jgi:hypothetical protein
VSLYLLLQWLNAFAVYTVAQEIKGGHTPHTLARVDSEAVCGKAFEDEACYEQAIDVVKEPLKAFLRSKGMHTNS